ADMISFNGQPTEITPPHYFEAPYMSKKNGTYYFSYFLGKNLGIKLTRCAIQHARHHLAHGQKE
ncbi:MAG: hypothetical protein ABJB86_22670, partial [Bacteroidota bacterium]